MLPPVMSNIQIDFSPHLFPAHIAGKYDKIFFNNNDPIKTIEDLCKESIQDLSVSGFEMPTLDLNGMNNFASQMKHAANTVNRSVSGNQPENETFENSVTFTMLNYMYNWSYFLEWGKRYFMRNRDVSEFWVNITLLDSAELPVMRFRYEDCFVTTVPPLTFSFTQSFAESSTFDLVFKTNRMSIDIAIPKHNSTEVEFLTVSSYG